MPEPKPSWCAEGMTAAGDRGDWRVCTTAAAGKFNAVTSGPLAPRWRLLLTPPLPGAVNMAIDVAMMALARERGEAICRVYEWSVPTLSFGRNQTARGAYDRDRLAHEGVPVVRRPTGGRAILHAREITYSVAAPATDALPLRTAYDRINALLLEALAALGVPAAMTDGRGHARLPDASPCFAAPSAGEMTAGGDKLVGSAQWRDGGALLQHGSILVEDDQRHLASLMTTPPAPMPAPATLHALLGRRPAARELATALFDAVRRNEDPGATPLDADEASAGARAHVAAFEDPAWTWRR